MQIHQRSTIDLVQCKQKLSNVATIQLTPFLLKAKFDNGISFVVFPDGRVLVQGTEDKVIARTWYDRYIGS